MRIRRRWPFSRQNVGRFELLRAFSEPFSLAHGPKSLGGVINLVRYGRHLLALSILEAKREPVDPELLSWCAYTCGGAGPGGRPSGRARPGALRLLFYVLRRWPQQVRQREEGTGKLALHDAAWGWAPVEAAVLLTAAHPKALEDRRNEAREAPHELGRYVHGRRFNWPDAAEMKARYQIVGPSPMDSYSETFVERPHFVGTNTINIPIN